MRDRDTDRLLREATSGLVRAVRALQDAGELEMALDTFALVNRVLQARQARVRAVPVGVEAEA